MEIREGQVLAHLDDSIPRKSLALAEAQLGSQRRALTENEVRLRQAKLSQDRMKRLHEQGVSTKADLDTADADVDALVARLELGRQDVQVSERQIALRRQDLDDTVIRAPFSGAAVSKDGERDVVFVIQGNKVERRAVGLAAGTAGNTDEAVVTSGLAAGEQVVVQGPADLKDGATVSVQGSESRR